MSSHTVRSVGLATVVSLFLTIGVSATELDGSGNLAVASWDQPDFGSLQPVSKEARLLAHNQDLALLWLPHDLSLPADLSGRITILERARSTGDYYIWQLESPVRAAFEAPTRVLYRSGHSLLAWSPEGPPRLTAESRAQLRGLVQPMRVTVDPKPWPAAQAETGAPGTRARTEFHPLVGQMVSEIDLVEYVDVWQTLDDFETRYTYTAQNEASAAWMITVFESYGLQAEYHYFNLDGQRKNVVATIPGLVEPDRVVYMTGHFDSISEDPYNSAPGADDNASGTAAFLEAARVLSQYPFHYTIKLVGFSGEEQGLYGSAAYVADIAAQGEDVIVCFNLDMIAYAGYDPYPPDLIIYTNNNSLEYAQLMEDAILEYVPQYVEPVVVNEAIGASDHASFWQYGYKAILGIEEEAWGPDFCPWYHTTQDRIEQYPQDYPTYNTMATVAAVAQTAVPLNPDYPFLVLDDLTVDDDNLGGSQGNDNGTLEYGETIELTATLRNVGMPDALGVQGELQCDDPHVTLLVWQASFGTIPGDGGLAQNSPPFLFTVSPDVPDGHTFGFQLAISESPDQLSLPLTAYAPDLQVIAFGIDDTAGGDGDGIPEPGEALVLDITVENQGSIVASGVMGVLQDGAFLDADPTPQGFGLLAPGGFATAGPFSVAVAAGAPPLYTSTLGLALTDAAAYDRTDLFPFNIGDVFADDMESGVGWTHYAGGAGFNDEWHLETYRNHTYGGTTSWKCGGPGSADYGDLLYAILESSPFSLPGNSMLTLWHWMDAETSGTYPDHCYDGGLVEISVDGGPWQTITPEAGYPYLVREGGTPGPFPAETPVFSGAHDWQAETFDLTGFAGSARIRFAFGSDGAVSREGWYIDDVELRLGISGADDTPLVQRLHLHPARPTPTAGGATLRLDLPQTGPVTVQVCDIRGRAIRTLLDKRLSAGSHSLVWDGRDAQQRMVASGTYWIRAQTPKSRCSHRLVLLR